MLNPLRKISPFARVLLAIVLGILTGLFFGERVASFEIVGHAYIRLLQMTVIPYIIVSLIGGLGSLDARMARRIGLRGGGTILLLWLVALVTLFCLPLAYPNWTSAAFFSSSLVTEREPFDPLLLYIPSNLFYALGQGLVPAVVVFSIAMGLALIAIDEKEELLAAIGTLGGALMKMATFVGRLAPIGIFAIAAAAAGTFRIEELQRLQVFLWVYLFVWCVLVFVTLPVIASAGSPFSYRDVMRNAREAMVTAFATGTVLVVLPLIADQCKRLLRERDVDVAEARNTIDVMVPTAYSFPSVGTLLGLGFVLFAAWYIGAPLSVDQYPEFATVGALVSFGSMAVAIPFMLDLFSLPADLFQLYLLGSAVTARFATALAALHGIVVSLLAATAVLGKLRVRAVVQMMAVTLGITAVAMLGLGIVLKSAIPYAYTGKESLTARALLGRPVQSEEIERTTPLPEADRARPRLDVIRERGSLRFGHLHARLPFAFRADSGETVGFDLDLAHRLAEDLGVTLEVVSLSWDEAVAALNDGGLDILGGGVVVTPTRALDVAFTRSYIDQSAGFVLPDRYRNDMQDLAAFRSWRGLRVAVAGGSRHQGRHYETRLRQLLPEADIVMIETPEAFFLDPPPGVEVMWISAQAGSAWTLLHPEYTMVVPTDMRMNASTAFALPPSALDLAEFMDSWVELIEKGGWTEALYEYWILGLDARSKPPRWSILTDVLGWGENTDPEER